MDNKTGVPVDSAPENIEIPQKVKTVKVKNLLMLILLILVVAVMVFGFLYYRGKSPLENVQPILTTTPPSFLYNIYEGQNKLDRPIMAAVYGNGTIYISNNSVHTIEVISRDGRSKKSFGGEGVLPGKLLYPYGIGFLPNGNLLVAETGNFRIQEFTARGEFVNTFLDQNNKIGLKKPGPIWVDSSGKIYIGDISGSQVFVLDQNAKVLRKIKNISFPHGIAVDEQNRRLFISDAGQVNVKVFSLDKLDDRPITVIDTFLPGMRFTMVRGLAVDKRGRLYVTDTIFNTIRVFDKDLKYLFSFGEQGLGDGEFLYPNQIFIDNKGKVYVTDWGNNRVQVWGY